MRCASSEEPAAHRDDDVSCCSRPNMADKPPCMSCCAGEWKAKEPTPKVNFEGTWYVENDMCGSKGDAMCCGKV